MPLVNMTEEYRKEIEELKEKNRQLEEALRYVKISLTKLGNFVYEVIGEKTCH